MLDRKNFRDSMRTMANPDPSPDSPDPQREILDFIPIWLLPTGVGLIAAVLILALVAGTRPDGDGPDPETAALQQQVDALEETVAATSTGPVCQPATRYLEIIAQQELSGYWDDAFKSAQTALQLENICERDEKLLAEKAVGNGLSAIWATPSTTPADFAAQQAAVSRYESLKRLSGSYAVPFPLSERQVAGEAYKVSQFLLAMLAMERGFETGQIDRDDQLQVAFYHDSVYNLGWWLAHHASGDLREYGLQLLATAAELDARYRLGRSLAAEELRRLVGADSRLWPEPVLSPLIEQVDDTGSEVNRRGQPE